VVEHVYDVDMRVVVAKVLAAAANAVLVAQHLLKLGAHLVIALTRLHVHNPTRRSSLEVGSTRKIKGADELKKCKKLEEWAVMRSDTAFLRKSLRPSSKGPSGQRCSALHLALLPKRVGLRFACSWSA
jgi:hypothetical protein